MAGEFDVVIVGSGMAGYAAAKAIAARGLGLRILMITQDAGDYYAKPTLSTAMAHGKPASALLMQTADQVQSQLGITLWPHKQVTKIDRVARKLVVESAEQEPQTVTYRFCVLACGATPKTEAAWSSSRVMAINDWWAYDRFRQLCQANSRGVVIGGGLVGAEFAHDAHRSGCSIDWVMRSNAPLPQLMPEVCGKALLSLAAQDGVRAYTAAKVESVVTQGEQVQVHLSDRVLQADWVVTALGLQPNTQLAQQAGLLCDQGIMVNQSSQTSDPAIWALGDCVQSALGVRMYVPPILQAAKVIADVLAEEPDPEILRPILKPITLKTSAWPVVIQWPLTEIPKVWWQARQDGGIIARSFGDDMMLNGYICVGSAVAEHQVDCAEFIRDNMYNK